MNDTTAYNPFEMDSGGEKLRRRGLFEKIVLKEMSQMTSGCLHLDLPDGTRRLIGNPTAPWSAKIQVRDQNFFKRVVLFGDVGFGESYVEGEWETDDITKVIAWAILNNDTSASMRGSGAKRVAINLLGKWNRFLHSLRPNSVNTSRRNIREHYDLGNDFYQLFLDRSMTYSSGIFDRPDQTLEQAQFEKYDRLCRELKICAKDHVLEIGSGWGGFCHHAASRYGCRVTTVTISKEQHAHASRRIQEAGLSELVDVRLQDYRHIEGKFDKIVSIEMLEAVGAEFLETYFAKCQSLLTRTGMLGIQVITCPDHKFNDLKEHVDWIQKHIFPGSLLLSIGRMNQAVQRTGNFFLHDLRDFGNSYARTLRLWHEEFQRRLESVRALGFDDRFIRKWNYYLCYCEAAFAMRNISVVQAVYTRANNVTLQEAYRDDGIPIARIRP